MGIGCTTGRKVCMRHTIKNYLEGRATKAEQLQLLRWLRNKENRFVFNSFSLEWKKGLDENQIPKENKEAWNRIQTEMLQKGYQQWQHSRKFQSFFKYAAIFFFVVSVVSFVWKWNASRKGEASNEFFTKVVAENGQISKVILPDGSTVWLNSGSEISYSNLFAENNRNIQLTGEAYFDVSHNEELPMVVSCGALKVKVLGTEFNVAAYTDMNGIEVVLEKGIVELLDSKVPTFQYQLKPGEMANFNKANGELRIREVNTTKFTAWKEGIMNIYDQPLDKVVKKLEARYNQKFKYSNEIRHYRYTFTIKNESMKEIIGLMEKITPIKAIQKKDTIYLKVDRKKIKSVDR